MSNWKERIGKEEELARRASLAVQRSRQEELEKREGNIRRLFELIENLNVGQLLGEIKRDVWVDGEVEHFEDGTLEQDRRFRVLKKGLRLIYRWSEPGQPEQQVVGHKKKFVLWEPVYGTTQGASGEYGTSEVGKRFKPHVESEPEYAYPVYHMKEKSTALPVFVELKILTSDLGKLGHGEEVGRLVAGSKSMDLARGPLFEVVGDVDVAAADFLDKALLDDCLAKKRNNQLPADIKLRAEERVAQIPASKLRYT